MRDQMLLTITVITDDSTGIYNIGELDFGKTGHCETFLAKAENREMFVEHLRWLADAAENGTSPFLPYNKRLNDSAEGSNFAEDVINQNLELIDDLEADR